MIKIAIIEDEIPARRKLKRFLEELEVMTEVVAEIDTVKTAVEFLKNTRVDLIFSDIELLDGNAFDIYNNVSVTCPIIFTTAYDQFWTNAFDSNGIAYLLKPFSKERFQKAWDKFILLRKTPALENEQLIILTKLIENNFAEKSYKKRFTIHTRQGIYFLDIDKIAFFEASESVVYAYDTTGKNFLLTESTLKEIEEQINPAHFFRINRSELVNKELIEKIERYDKNTLAVKIKGTDKYLKTSQSSTSAFRAWVEK